MSPQQTLSSPVRIRTISFDRPLVRGTSALAEPAIFETLVINPAPPFSLVTPSRVTPLRLVEGGRSSAAGAVAAKTLKQGQIRLTRRGRLALVGVALMCMLLGFSIGNVVSFSAGVAAAPTSSHSIVVSPGQTLWAIATQAAPKADPRATVQQIIVLNHLASTQLQPGQTLALPS